MIQTITKREYAVACDGCGQTGPAADSLDEARRNVYALGWHSLTPIPNFDFLTTWLCPICQQHRNAAGQ